MTPAIAYSLPLAIGVMISALPLTLIPLILLGHRDRRPMAWFLCGWSFGFLLIGSVALLLADVITPNPDGPPAWVNWARMLLGSLLLWLAWRQWGQRPHAGEPPVPPGWLSKIDGLTPRSAGTFGLLLSTVNPKYTALICSGALTIASATSLPRAQFGALLVFAAVSSLGVFMPLLLWWLFGKRVLAPLEKFKGWMVQYNATIMALVLASLGVVVMGNGIREL
jgi:hypothetical protein